MSTSNDVGLDLEIDEDMKRIFGEDPPASTNRTNSAVSGHHPDSPLSDLFAPSPSDAFNDDDVLKAPAEKTPDEYLAELKKTHEVVCDCCKMTSTQASMHFFRVGF